MKAIAAFLAWQQHTMDRLGVRVRLGTPLTAEMVKEQKPDAVIVATGSEPSPTGIWGSGHDFVVHAADVLEGKVPVGESVAVIGGGMVGCETANHLAHHGKNPTIIEMLSDLASEEPRDMKRFLMESLDERKVPIYTDSKVMAIDADGCVKVSRGDGVNRLGPFENVILAGGMRPLNGLAGELEGVVGSLSVVGDAVAVDRAQPRKGYQAALSI
jgi:pyruvate/2-oxoglutarate dehydrogenase complex dihydrolipoamide dehydrogenase (E3) component